MGQCERVNFAIPAQSRQCQPHTAANSEAVSRTAQHLGSEASQAMSPTPPTAPPTANQCLAQAHHTVDPLQQQLRATAVLSWHENSFSSSSSRVQQLRRSEFPWRKKEEPADEVKDGTNNQTLDAMVAQTHINLLKAKEEDNPFDFGSCLHKAMPAEGSEVFGNA